MDIIVIYNIANLMWIQIISTNQICAQKLNI